MLEWNTIVVGCVDQFSKFLQARLVVDAKDAASVMAACSDMLFFRFSIANLRLAIENSNHYFICISNLTSRPLGYSRSQCPAPRLEFLLLRDPSSSKGPISTRPVEAI